MFNYNGLEDTTKCLKSLLKTEYKDYKILVIDDGSKNDELSELKRVFSKENIHFFSDGLNKGFSVRANEIINSAKSKYVILLNNDTVVDPKWLQYLINAVEKDNKIAVCQSKLKSMNFPDYFEYAGGCGGYLDKLGYPYTKGRIMFSIEKDVGQYDQEDEIFWACGAAMLIRTSVALRIGGFDESLFAYAEEVDFCWRIKKLGYKVKIIPRSIVFHKGAGFWSKKLARKTYLLHRNHFILLIKHLEIKELIWILPTRLLFDFLSIIYYMREGTYAYALAVLKAHFYIITRFLKIFKSRSTGRPVERYPFSIVFNYFILNKVIYSQIMNLKKINLEVLNYRRFVRTPLPKQV
ncbi:MAG: glycosyltransferase family 2 protein [Actinobacteria bacterium]|nr:glycosyltransferase family 2 protein [Actinomycetota bacterium]